MKEKLTNNIGLKLFSLFLAFLLWSAVMNSQDPLETATFENVPVTVINEDSLTAKDKIPEIIEGETITVVVEARRSICDALTKEDIEAVADFEKISLTGAVPIEVSVNGYTEREVEIVRGLNQMMKLSLEDSVSREFRVKIATSGETATGYVTGDMTASPNVITLTGSSTQINNIKEVVLVADITGIFSERQVIGIPILYDMNGEVVDNSKVTMSASSVKVNIPVLKTKTVRLNVETVGEPADGYEMISVSYQPQTVTVAGSAYDLLMLNSLTAYCDISGATGSVEKNFDISALWEEELTSLRLVDEEELAVTVTIREFEEKVLEIQPEDIALEGLAAGLKAEIVSLSQNQIRVKGSKEALESASVELIAPYLDMSMYVKGGFFEREVLFTGAEGLELKDRVRAEIRVTVVTTD